MSVIFHRSRHETYEQVSQVVTRSPVVDHRVKLISELAIMMSFRGVWMADFPPGKMVLNDYYDEENRAL